MEMYAKMRKKPVDPSERVCYRHDNSGTPLYVPEAVNMPTNESCMRKESPEKCIMVNVNEKVILC